MPDLPQPPYFPDPTNLGNVTRREVDEATRQALVDAQIEAIKSTEETP